MVLGFGGRGHDLLKSFDVKYLGEETVDGVKTVKLELLPKAEKVKKMFSRFILWIDLALDVSRKQQAFEPSGDFRTATYSNIKRDEKVPDDTFKLKTTSKTKVVRPQ
jgi:outer membrane lipoprotein-sorting protein